MESEDIENVERIKNTLRSRLQQSGVNNLIRHMVRDICESRGEMSDIEPDHIIEDLCKKGLMKKIMENLELSEDFEAQLEQKIQAHLESHLSSCEQGSHTVNTSSPHESGTKVNDNENSKTSPADRSGRNEERKLHSDRCREDHFNAQVVTEGVPNTKPAKGLLNGKFFLKFVIDGGRSFLDQLFVSEGSREECLQFVLHVSYRSQRFYSNPTPCHCEPAFNDTFMIDIGYFENGSILQLLATPEPIRILLLQETQSGERRLLSSHSFDWRSLLMSDKCFEKIPITLMGIGPEFQVPVGTLTTRLTILPHLPEILTASTFTAQINAERSIQNEKERLFLIYVKQWLREYMEIRPQHSKRFIKIFSYDENTKHRPVQSFVKPIVADNLILTPVHAAWFVSLVKFVGKTDEDSFQIDLPFRAYDNLDAPKALCDHWQSLITTLTTKAGGVEDHATLLCSLLLGFGLDAYVGCGTKSEGVPWVWVITLDADNHATFWESTNGVRYSQYEDKTSDVLSKVPSAWKQKESHDIRTISCLFSNHAFYANIQASNFIDVTDWNLSNPSKWKKIPESTLKSSTKFSEPSPELMMPTKSPTLYAKDLEAQLKTLVSEMRLKNNLHSRWDHRLSQLLKQELARYELEASSGATDLPSYFQSAVLKSMPAGYEFKGYPWCGNCGNAHQIFQMLLRNSRCQEIITCRGNDVQLALRVQVFAYPENIISTRVMLGCKFVAAE